MLNEYIFLLGREPELSLAELRSIFPGVTEFSVFALIQSSAEQIESIQNGLGGTIKIGKILASDLRKDQLLTTFTEKVREKSLPGKKLRIALDVFSPALSSLVFKAKDTLKNEGCSVRVVQHDVGRVKTATTLHEKLISQGLECMVIPSKNGFILAETVWVQDIDSYSKRDMERERSMVVGMMPPKIAQIMINLASRGDKKLQIYDSFCGLGTTIIEASNAGYGKLMASDISSDMVRTTTANVDKIGVQCDVFLQDARKINEKHINSDTVIVTEGMLGKNFTTSTITHTQVLQERRDLTALYSDFFHSSWQNPAIQALVFCLPFWNIGRETVFMPEISDMSGSWSLDPICKSKKRFLQHIRPTQSVGREIVVLRREKTSENSLVKIK